MGSIMDTLMGSEWKMNLDFNGRANGFYNGNEFENGNENE